MASIENCVSVCSVPNTQSKESLLQLVSHRGLRGLILGAHKVPENETENKGNLTRWIIWLELREDARNFLEKLKGKMVEFEGRKYPVTYEKTNPHEIPDNWLQGRRKLQPCTTWNQQGTVKPGHLNPQLTPSIYIQQEQSHRQSYQEDQEQYETVFDETEIEDEEQEQYDTMFEQENASAEEEPTKIVVHNLPSTVHEEYLEMFFENKRKFGGGPVSHIDFDEENLSAVVEFEEAEAVGVVLNKRPIKMMGQVVTVDVYKSEEVESMCTIEVTGPCSIVCEEELETLEMYFESERHSGGGEVLDCKYENENNMILVTFKDQQVAYRVLERARHVVKKEILKVKLHVPSKDYKNSDKALNAKKDEAALEPVKTIKVTGVDKTDAASRDTVELYFESKRHSGGGDIETIMSDEEEEDVLYITYKYEEVAKTVVERGCHTLGGCELEVSLYIPPKPIPCYDNKVLIKGLNPQTTQDILFNFIKTKTDFAPESMVYHSQKKDIVMVTMKQHSDFKYEILKKLLASSKLEGSRLKLAKVPISKRIMVSNLVDGVTRDTVKYYFENKRRSGGGSVTKILMIDDNACFVYFEDYKTIDSVLERHHSLGGKQLSVQVFPDCLDLPEGGTGERTLKVPDHLVLKSVDSKKLRFMRNSKITRCMIEQRLKTVHTKIIWPKETGDIVLECILTKQDENCFKLVKTWKKDAENSFDDFMKNIVVHKIDVSQELWSRVIEQLKNINCSKPEAAAVFVERIEGMITVVGNTPVADPIAKEIYEIKRKAMNELEKERHTIREVVNALKPIEMKMLVCDKYPSKMEEEFAGLKVRINLNRNNIVFEGPSTYVQNAKLKMFQIKSCYEYQTCKNISKQKQTLYQSRQTKEFIVKKLKNKNVTAVWEVQQSGSLVICSKRGNLEESVSTICESVKEKSITLRGASQSVMNSEQWTCELDKMYCSYQGKCQIDVSEDTAEIYICATDVILDEIVDSVEKILHVTTVLVEVSCSRNANLFIERHHKDALTKISNDLKSSYVRVTSLTDYGGFEVRGTGAGVKIAKKGLIQLLRKIKKREHTMDMPCLTDYMKTPKGKDSINTIETCLSCVVTVKGDGSETHSDVSLYERVPADIGVSENVGVYGRSVGDIWRKLKKQAEPTYAEPEEKKSHDIVTFIILAMSEDIIDIAVERLECFLQREICIKQYKENAIKNMDDNELMEIKAIAEQDHIRLNLDAKKGSIEIAGIANNVMSASDKIHRILRDAITLEQQQSSADLLSDIVQWFYIEISETGSVLQPYDRKLNYKIENAYNSRAPNFTFWVDQFRYCLDLRKMEEYVVGNPDDKVSVLRRDLIKHRSSGGFKPPATWDDMIGTLNVVALQSGSPEYKDITQKFTISSGGSFNISKIERIQNKTLLRQYQEKKKQLEDQNPQGTRNERLLWHGANPDAVENINAHGFNRSHCGPNATAYGNGVYFAVNASYHCSNTYSRPDASGLKRVYYCRVLTGEYAQGNFGMRVPPPKAGGASTALYDSVSGPGMFIIFSDTQAYPEYLLTFK